MTRPFFIRGLLIALGTLALDQVSKWWLMTVLKVASAPQELTGFFNLVMVWNQGISFGMFAHESARWILIALSLVITAVLIAWLRRVERAHLAAAIGLVLGGALGNVIDRLRYGAVADFFDFHLLGYHWPAFNIADSAIFLGVVILCWDSLKK